MDTNKVSEIEFHLSSMYELEDFTLRAAELIKEGYHYVTIKEDPYVCSYISMNTEPILHIKMRKKI